MAPWSRKRKAAPEPTTAEVEPEETVRLDGDDHAWWVKEEVTTAWQPRAPQPSPEPERDILAEHFGPDWRTSFGFTPSDDDADSDGSAERSPYDVLEVPPTATWDEIVAAHRHQVRIHHPDRLFGQSEEEKAEGEEAIRVINAAYQELRIRRGM